MSLILDALKKSEAERRRGQPPSLHGSSYAPRRRPSRAPWFAGAGAVLLAAGLTGAFYYLQRPQAGAPMSADQSPASAPGAPATAGSAPVLGTEAPVLANATEQPPAAPPPGSPEAAMLGGMDGGGTAQTVSGGGLPVPVRAGLYTPTVLPPPVVAAEPPPAPPSAPPAPPTSAPAEPVAVQPVPVQAAPANVAPPPAPSEVKAPPVVEAPVSAPALAAIPPAAEPSAEQLPNMYQLPYATRKDLPKLTLSMHVYSPLREERFIVLNGKRYTLDNAQPGPDLTLLDIVADGAVMEFRGQRFLLPRQTY